MDNDISINALLNNGIAVGVMWYVLFRINPILKDLTDAINKLGNDIDKRLDKLEEKTNQLSYKIEFLSKEDSHVRLNR